MENEMTTARLDRRTLLLGALAALALPAAGAPLPGDSVYQLDASLVDQRGQRFTLASRRGEPMLVSMFYTSCQMVCPMIIETIQATLKALPPEHTAAMRVLLVSFDPARDTVTVLAQTAQARGCDARWTLARADEATVRAIAAVLGIQYRRLASGEFNHSSVIELLDRDGRIAAKTAQLGAVDATFVKAIRHAREAA
jgi:protein SCO1/2